MVTLFFPGSTMTTLVIPLGYIAFTTFTLLAHFIYLELLDGIHISQLLLSLLQVLFHPSY